MKIGILALQGACEPHEEKLRALSIPSKRVLMPSHLEDLSGIILPGGESTTQIHLLKTNNLWEPLRDFVFSKPAWGVCAGAILLAKTVTSPVQDSLGKMDLTIERNGFGRQNESFESGLQSSIETWDNFWGTFIRAPRIKKLGERVVTLMTYQNEPVMVEDGTTLVTTFHPELGSSVKVHQYFADKCHG